MSRPNILFIQVDQLAAESLAAYGNRVCHTPNLDKLSADSFVFNTAYCNFPLCAPSRFSMATGQLCSEIGAYDNAAEMPATIPTYAHYLRRAGYHTALSGKMHFIGPDQHHGFETRLTPDLYPTDFSWVPNWGDEGERDTNDQRSVTISGICERSKQIDFDDLVTNNAIQHIYDRVRSDSAQPFFLQVSYTHPHEPYLCRPEYWALYNDKEMPLPRVPALPAEQHDQHSRRLLEDFGMLDAGFSDEDIQRSRRAHYGSISYIDELVGRILSVLESTGLYENTAVVFTSDHGDMLGERGMWFKKHFYEPSLRVPLFMRLPGTSGRRVDTPASLVDLLPTFMGIAEGRDKSGESGWTTDVESLEGNDLATMINSPDDPERAIYAEYLAEATTSPIYMIRRGPYKFIHCDTDPVLLFNLDTDPDERHNLAEEAEHATLIKKFTEEMQNKWDTATLSEAIRLSQKRRRLVLASSKNGLPPRWNHGEIEGEDVVWYRGEQGYNEWAFDYLPVTD